MEEQRTKTRSAVLEKRNAPQPHTLAELKYKSMSLCPKARHDVCLHHTLLKKPTWAV